MPNSVILYRMKSKTTRPPPDGCSNGMSLYMHSLHSDIQSQAQATIATSADESYMTSIGKVQKN